jgi:hypothetical protein
LDGPAHKPPAPRPRRGQLLLWGALAAAAGLAVAPLEPNVLEEGIVIHTAERMAQGDHLYRDVISPTAPLPYELLALLFEWLGSEIAVARSFVVGLQVVGTISIYALATRVGAGGLAHLAAAAVAAAPIALIPLFSIFYYTTLAFYLASVAVYAGVRAVDSSRWAVATGALLAAIALCKQSSGVLLAVAFVPLVASAAPAGLRLARAGQLALGGGAIGAATLTLYALRGDLDALFYAQLELAFALASAPSFHTPFINLWPPGELDAAVRESWVMYLPNLYHLRYGLHTAIGAPIAAVTQLLYALPFAVLAATGLVAATRRLPTGLWLHTAFLAAMVLNLFPRSDWGHLVVALPPAAVQIALLLGTLPAVSARVRRAVSAAGVALLMAACAGLGFWLHDLSGAPSFGPRLPLRPISRATLGPALPRVIHYLRGHAQPGEAIFVARQEPLLYFATETTNPTPFEGVLPGLRELQEPVILEALEQGVRFVVMSDIDQPHYTFYSDELPAVWSYLERHYRIPLGFRLDDASWITVLERGPDRGATAIDLLEVRPDARAWTLERDGHIQPIEGVPQRLAARQLKRPLPIVLGSHGGGVDFELDIPVGAVFQAAVGYRGLVSVDHRYVHPPGTTAVVSIRPKGADAFEELAALSIDDRPAAGRRWRPIEADLARFEGSRATLRLAFRARRPLGRDRLAWFGSPRIALRR